jgi:hypothetical protein
MISRKQAFRLLVVVLCFAAFLACNVFVSLDRCKGDGDCPLGSFCDTEGKFCVRLDGGPTDSGPDVFDAGTDASDADSGPPGPCDLTKGFGKPVLVKGLENVEILSARFTTDESDVYLAIAQDAGDFRTDILTAPRGPDAAAPYVLAPLDGLGINSPESAEYWPTLSSTGKTIFFESSRGLDGGNDQARIWKAKRNDELGDFDPPELDKLFKTDLDNSPYLHPDQTSLYFVSVNRDGGKGNFDIYKATIGGSATVTQIDPVDAVNSASADMHPLITRDDKALYFAREVELVTDAGSLAHRRIFVAKRNAPGDTFGAPTEVEELTTEYEQFPSWISDNQCRLYFISNRPTDGTDAGPDGGPLIYRVWVATRP